MNDLDARPLPVHRERGRAQPVPDTDPPEVHAAVYGSSPVVGAGGVASIGSPRAGAAGGRSGRRFLTITVRTVMITCVVALVSVLTTAAIAWPLADRAAYQEARQSLATRADFV